MTRIRKTIIITGTHHTPALELIKQLKRDTKFDWNIHYIGHIYPSETHIKNSLLPLLEDNFHHLECGKFDRRFPSKTLSGIPLTISAFFKAFNLLSHIKPDLVVSFGGYVSVPVIIASFFKHFPSITHEQTLTNSLSTKINSFFVSKIALSFDNPAQVSSLSKSKVVITGNLLRSEIFSNESDYFSKTNFNFGKFPLLYITGGNQGSKFINDIILQILPSLLKTYAVIHQTGALEYQEVKEKTSKLDSKRYLPLPYINSQDIGWVFHHSSLILSRSGANICQEISALKLPVIFIPHPYTQQNEQLLNAQWVQKQLPQSTHILDQFTLTPEILLKTICSVPPVSIQKFPQEINNYHLLNLIHELA